MNNTKQLEDAFYIFKENQNFQKQLLCVQVLLFDLDRLIQSLKQDLYALQTMEQILGQFSDKKKKKEQCNVVQYPATLTPQRISRDIPH